LKKIFNLNIVHKVILYFFCLRGLVLGQRKVKKEMIMPKNTGKIKGLTS